MRRVYYALIVLAVLVLSLWLMIHYDVLTLARAFLAPAWRSAAVVARAVAVPAWQGVAAAVRPVVENYLLRRAEAPISNLLFEGAMALVGYRALARLSARARQGTVYATHAIAWWKARHRVVRWSIGSGVVLGAGFFGFGLLILPMWLPLSTRVLQSLHFWWFDRFVDRWIAPLRRRFRHAMRTNRFWRVARRPYRILLYSVAVGVRRGARGLRRIFVHVHRPRALADPENSAPARSP